MRVTRKRGLGQIPRPTGRPVCGIEPGGGRQECRRQVHTDLPAACPVFPGSMEQTGGNGGLLTLTAASAAAGWRVGLDKIGIRNSEVNASMAGDAPDLYQGVDCFA